MVALCAVQDARAQQLNRTSQEAEACSVIGMRLLI